MKKDIILFLGIFLILSMITGGTYAYWRWVNPEDTTVVFNTIKGIDDYVYYDAGESHFVGNFQPSSNHCGGQSNTISFYIKDGTQYNPNEHGKLYTTIMMDINEIDSSVASSSAVKWAVTQGSGDDCGNILASGDFIGKSSGSSFQLVDNLQFLNQSSCVNGNDILSNCKYTVWVWIDSNGSNLNSLSGKTINLNIWSRIDMVMDVPKAAGLYDSNGNFTSWDTLVANNDITVSSGVITASNTELTGELVISDTVTEIGGDAFWDTALTSVIIPNSVISIGEMAFYETPLTNVVIGNSVTNISSTAFGWTSLTSVVIPKSVTSIGFDAFGDTSLTDVYYEGTEEEWNAISISDRNDQLVNATKHYNYTGDSNDDVGDNVETKAAGLYKTDGTFISWDTLVTNGDITVSSGVITASNPELTGELVISDTVTSIGEWAFEASELIEVIIPNTVTSIGEGAFATAVYLTSVIIPDSVTSLEDYTFTMCESLSSVVIPNSVTSIGDIVFNETNITNLVIPNSVKTIGETTFAESSITSVVIPKSIISIGNDAFGGTPLTDVYYEGTEIEWNAISISDGNDPLVNATKHYNYSY